MTRKRILLYCHDGTGLGHLRRISRIAEALQREHSCLIVTGTRDALWLAPQACEVLKLPSWYGIDRLHAARQGKSPAIEMSRSEALILRRELLLAASRAFRPDAIIVDYLPFGSHDELRPLFSEATAKKFLIHRGITDTSDEPILRGGATLEIASVYDRILVMADKRVTDLAATDRYCARAAEKIVYCGYALPDIPQESGGVCFDVVCCGGGGAGAEELMIACIRAAESNTPYSFCIVLGPRSRLSAKGMDSVPPNAKIVDVSPKLPALLSGASVIVTTGGYNSMMEAIRGGGRIIVCPNQRGADDEQQNFASTLSRVYPVSLARDPRTIPETVSRELQLFAHLGRASFPLSAEGLSTAAKTIASELDNTHGTD